MLEDLNEMLDDSIDIDAFENGKKALILTDNPELYGSVDNIEVSLFSGKTFSSELGGSIPYTFYPASNNIAPTFFISNAFLDKLESNAFVASVYLDVADGFDEQTFSSIQENISNSSAISMTSRLQSRQDMQDSKTILYVLGGGISLILSLIGILNFLNVMSVEIIARKREFAILESIGMSKRQIRSMIRYEGLGYAVI